MRGWGFLLSVVCAASLTAALAAARLATGADEASVDTWLGLLLVSARSATGIFAGTCERKKID